MSSPENPFSSPSIDAGATLADSRTQTLVKIIRATRGRRLANYFVDVICVRIMQEVCGFLLGFAAAFYASAVNDDSIYQYLSVPVMILFGLLTAFVYYFVLEAAFGRTLGKLASGTKVVDKNGNHPTIGQIAKRTLCRFIPFEPFTFLVGDRPRGWHDSFSRTYVVKIKE